MVIKEYLPNPPGKDTEGEYIILENDSQESVNLSGWMLKDKKGKVFNLNGYSLEQGEELKLFYKTTKITLNNDGEVLELYDKSENLVDKLEYTGTAKEGFVVKKNFEITQEMKEEFLEGIAVADASSNLNPAHGSSGSLIVLILALGVVLASLSLWILKKVE